MTIVKSVLLPLPPVAAFDLFTRRIREWWPADRRHSDDPESDVFILEGGRFYERTRDGREVELGHVRFWEIPSRIILDFFIATGPEQPTEVEISFEPARGGTEVTVVHRPKPASEALWDGRSPRYAGAWDAVLSALAAAASGDCLS